MGEVYNYRGNVLMLDARNIYRKVIRKIYDFSPKKLVNLTAIVWLYRGQKDRFLGLVKEYFGKMCDEGVAITGELEVFETVLIELRGQLSNFAHSVKNLDAILPEQLAALANALAELADAAYNSDCACLVDGLVSFRGLYETAPSATNLDQHSARRGLRSAGRQSQGTSETGRPALQTRRALYATLTRTKYSPFPNGRGLWRGQPRSPDCRQAFKTTARSPQASRRAIKAGRLLLPSSPRLDPTRGRDIGSK